VGQISPRPILSVNTLKPIFDYLIDYCFNPDDSNQAVYEKSSLRAIVMSSLEGINGTVFMYGQTGAGKTFTMLGNGGMSMRKQQQTIIGAESEQLSPKSARLNLRRAASSARSKPIIV
jgi:chromosomal replication initiation ATPase DnaA